jgi:hypothetical protein
VPDELRALGGAGQIAGTSRLSGGSIADLWLVAYADGTQVIAKTITGAAPGLAAIEADGLAVLHGTGYTGCCAT